MCLNRLQLLDLSLYSSLIYIRYIFFENVSYPFAFLDAFPIYSLYHIKPVAARYNHRLIAGIINYM
jgi:hypothetical protein